MNSQYDFVMHTLAILLSLIVTTAEAEGLRATAPRDLTIEEATEHLTAARAVAQAFNIDETILLAIAYRESRYTLGLPGRPINGRMACGVMQVIVKLGRCAPQSHEDEYTAGALELTQWMKAQPDIERALLGYAGGYRLLNHCKTEPKDKRCGIGRAVLARAKRIKRSLSQSRSTST